MSLLLAFYAEQLMFVCLSLTLTLVFYGQIKAEKLQRDRMDRRNIKWKLHRLGLSASVLWVFIAVDPMGIHGVYPKLGIEYAVSLVTCLIVWAMVVLAEVSVMVIFAPRQPPKYLPHVFFGVAMLTFLVCTLSYALQYIYQKHFYSGIFLLWLGVTFSVLVVAVIVSTRIIIKSLAEMSQSRHNLDRDMHRESRASGLKARAIAVGIGGLVAVPTQIAFGIMRFRDTEAPLEEINEDEFAITDRIFQYFQFVAIFIVLWYSWLPMRREEYEAVATSENDSWGRLSRQSSSSRYGSSRSISSARRSVSSQRRERAGTDSMALRDDLE